MSPLITIFLAFCVGVIGSALGAFPNIILCALVVLVGAAANICGSDFNWVADVGFGFFLGPHICFAPACCAAAYAKMRGYLPDSKDIVTPLASLKRVDVLVVGGVFAILGWYINVFLSTFFAGGLDTVAMTVFIISLLGRVLFARKGLKEGLLGAVPEGGRRYSVADVKEDVWVPYQTISGGVQLLLTGMVFGGIAAYFVYLMCSLAGTTGNTALIDASIFPVWCVAVVAFFTYLSGCPIPIFHHIGFVAAYMARVIFLNGGSLEACLVWGIAFGILSAFLGDYLSKTFMVYGEGFVDPPTMAIATGSIIVFSVIPLLGAHETSSPLFWSLPIVLIILEVALGVYKTMKYNKWKSSQSQIEENMETA
ncbi:hypothetical protein [Eubacterium barkeri]|uniref:DUF7973 domain-containing protein n=1 Tax=Eubacterium barkeri TaxID=1528 RepID=A0A1H3FBD5_EUBBA|nr:hypothetical protein [Eubacterium barkeri]SDX87514.1 hypothetical protein SAMN04488579_10990 [Eubacterium barkeri]